MKAKKPTAARKLAAKAKKPATRKAKAPARAPRRPAKKKQAVRKKVSLKKVRKTTKAKIVVRAKVKRTAKPVRARAKKKTVPKTAAKTKPAVRRVPIQKLLFRPARRPKRIIKLPAFLRRPARKLEPGKPVATERRTPIRRVPISPSPGASKAGAVAQEAPVPVGKSQKVVSKKSPKTIPKAHAQPPASDVEAIMVPGKLPAMPKSPDGRRGDESDFIAAKSTLHPPRQLGDYRRQAIISPGRPSKKSAPAPALPAIIFEGDHPARPATHPASAPMPPHNTTHQPVLPEAHGTQRVAVTARDPHWLYVHWDLTREQLRHYNAQSVHRHLVLRVHENKVQGEATGEIHVHPESRHWFVHVPQAAVTHVVELGYYRKSNGWVCIGISSPTATPAAATSPDTEVRFATIPHNVTLPRLAEITRPVAGKTRPLVEAVEALRALGHPELPSAPPGSAMPPMTPEQERVLFELICKQHPAIGTADSAGITELLRGGLPENLSSFVTAAGGGISSLSSPHGGTPAAQREFWFNINAELIVYGATEPTASVTIGGREVKLRPDGSFSYRFTLPDGQYELPITAVSADGTEARHADLNFSRATNLVGEVGQHPQDPALKTPAPENLT